MSHLNDKDTETKNPNTFSKRVFTSFSQETEGRVTAVVAKVSYQATDDKTHQRIKHSAGRCTSNSVIKVLLDSGSDDDLLFYEKGTPIHFPHLTRQVPCSWHTSNGNFLIKERSEVNLKFCD